MYFTEFKNSGLKTKFTWIYKISMVCANNLNSFC